MAHDVGCHVEHVLRQDVLAAADVGQRPRREDQVDRGARAGAVGDVALELGHPEGARRAGRAREPDRVLVQRRVDVHAVDGLLERRRDRSPSAPAGRPRGGCHPLDDRELLGRRRVPDDDLEHEPVDLGLRERVRALGLDRVLRREHEERVRHRVGLVGDRDLALLHHLEQGGLDLGGRAVDLVGEEEVREHRPERGRELAGLLVEDPRPDEVRRHEVGRELDPVELAADRLGERLDRHRLREARHALDEEVAPGEERDDHPLEQVVLPDDDLLDLVQQLLHRGGGSGVRVAVHGRHLLHRSVLRQAGATAGDVDRHGQPDADEHVFLGRVDERGHDADDVAVAIDAAARPSCPG